MIAPTDILNDAWRRAWTPPDRRSWYEWAAANVDLQGQYKTTGPFSIADSRHLIFPFELLARDEVRMVNVLKGIQSGGTLLGDIFFQYVFGNAPGPYQATFQTDDDSEQHYLTRIEPTSRASANAALFAQVRKKRDLLIWPHMNAYFCGANENSLQRKSLKYLHNSEVWAWAPGYMGQAFARTEAFRRVCKILNESQAGNQGSEWESVCNNGHRFEWGIRCDRCGRLQPLSFFGEMEDDPNTRAGIIWDKSARYSDGRWDIARAAETTRFKCCRAGCGHEHVDEFRTWERFNAAGDYVDMTPERSMTDCTVHWNSMVTGDWWALTKRFLQACEVRDQGSTIALEDFYKKYLALHWDASVAEKKATVHLSEYKKEEPLSPGYVAKPQPNELIRFITADYQQGSGNDTRHLICGCRVWTETGDSRLIWEARCNTFEQLFQISQALGVPPARVGVDGSFDMMEVAAQCAKYGFTMLIGDDPEYFMHKRKKGTPIRRPYSELFKVDPGKGTRNQGRSICIAMRWSNPAIKNVLWNLRHGLTKLKWELPGDLSPSWRDGIDSEEKRRKLKRGTAEPVYEWTRYKRNNHPWDCECMQIVMAVAAECLSFDVEEKPEDKPKDKTPPAPKKTEAPTPPHDQVEQLELLTT